LLSFGMISAAGEADGSIEFRFEQHEIVTGAAKGQTVLTGVLLGGRVANVAVVSLDENADRRLQIYEFGDGTWRSSLEATLRRDVKFVDVARIGGRDRLLTYAPGRLSWFDPEAGTEHLLVAVTSGFEPPRASEIPHVDVSRDVSGDGRDDLVVPDVAGFRIFTQLGDGTFSDPVRIGPSTGPGWVYGAGGYRHDPWEQGGVHQMDYDRDGRIDLALWSGGHFAVHRQDERGRFDSRADAFTANVALDGGRNSCSRRPENGFDSYEVCYESDHSALDTGDEREKMLHSFTDLNGDGVADLVVYSLSGRSVFSVRSTYEVYPGSPEASGGIAFASSVGTVVPSDALQVVMDEHDYDGDGQTDMMVTSVNIGFFKVAGALLTGSMSADLRFYRMEDGIYPEQPNATRKIKLDLSREVDRKKAVSYATVLVGDVNGDGRADLLMGKGRKELRVFLGVPGPELFSREPQKVATAIPRGREYAWLTDLNGDGKQDVLMHHPSATEPHRVTLLVAR
jgi:hypothetical protein